MEKTPPKTNMAMEKQAFEDVSPIKKMMIVHLVMLVFFFSGAVYPKTPYV